MTAAIGPRTVAAVLVAAGSGSRLGADVPKAFCELGGQTLLEHAATRFLQHRAIGSLVIVAPASHVEQAKELIDDVTAQLARFDAMFDAAGITAVAGTDLPPPPSVQVVAGGATRTLSVLAGLAVLGPEVGFVLVHDVARPFVPRSMIKKVLDALLAGADAVVPVVPIHDTVRRVDAVGKFVGVVDRSELVAVQSPQGFRRAALDAAHAAGSDLVVTDDAALVEAMGGVVAAVPGSEAAFKITHPWDLTVAGSLLETMSVDG